MKEYKILEILRNETYLARRKKCPENRIECYTALEFKNAQVYVLEKALKKIEKELKIKKLTTNN